MPPDRFICLAATSSRVRVEHLGHRGVGAEHGDDALGVIAMPVHPDPESLQAAQHQP